ncbi:MAG TPA: Gfo/Idh/MocA family oxidoreductase [Acidimicrobiia bacterium]|nr:Gfo/Idh/MocA family oxidoreductase [Acidimicrobiia bacterium]
MDEVRIAVVGVGLIGRRHVAAIGAASGVRLAALVDPASPARSLGDELGVPWFPDLGELPEGLADGVILATPNAMHVDGGLACIARGLPVLIEKPLAIDVSGARRLVEAAAAAGVQLLVGHHRRHNPIVATAKEVIESGEIGRVVSVQGMFWLRKPDDYFEVAWRREPGAGPVLLNLIHDIDLLRHLVGEIVSVQAVASNGVRGNSVEDAAAAIFEFESGAIGAFNVSDAIPSPWSWELTSGENQAYPHTDQSCYLIGGTEGSLELPRLRVWTHAGGGGWYDPIVTREVPYAPAEPLVRQVEHFAAVIRGEREPLVSGDEGMRTLAVIDRLRSAFGRSGFGLSSTE